MSRKAFQVQVELDVQAVTCPGVWLCSNGKVSLQIYMLGSCVQTASYKPNFPIQCNETFVFYKTFYSKHQLNELQRELHDQWLYVELVQWKSCEVGNVLASFQTTLDELLYPSTTSGSIAGVDLDLLMEPSKNFPGKIAPKVEVSTKTTIEETLCVCSKPSSSTVVVNPKMLLSTVRNSHENIARKVCHSIAFSKRKPKLKPVKTRPPFCYRRAEDDLILRKPNYDLDGNYCSCRQSKSLERVKNVSLAERTELNSKQRSCPCTTKQCINKRKENFCPVCAKYKGYFNESADVEVHKKPTAQGQPRTTLFDVEKKTRQPKGTRSCCRPAFATSEPNSSDEERDKSMICLCPERSLAQKLHAKLTKTLSSIPKPIDWSCYYGDEDDDEDESCDCQRPSSRAELYRDLQKFYGDLYEKTRSKATCVPDCPGYK